MNVNEWTVAVVGFSTWAVVIGVAIIKGFEYLEWIPVWRPWL